eukprot:Skav234291  [mRNA]  locus=scaffold2271:161723:163444:+ [translate_table: standard]
MRPLSPFFDNSEYRIDFVALFHYAARPVISALGVYIFLRRPERSSGKSRLHVWCYRSVLWFFVSSFFADETITYSGNETVTWMSTNWTWNKFQVFLFAFSNLMSIIFQMHIANLKLRCLSWNRFAVFSALLVAALALAVVALTVSYMVLAFSPCPYTLTVYGCESEVGFVADIVEMAVAVCLSLIVSLGPVQSIGMWCVACKVLHASNWHEVRSEFRCLCVSALLTAVGSPLSAVLLWYVAWTYRLDNYSTDNLFQIMILVDLTCQTCSSLLLGGMIGPAKWSKPMDLFSTLGERHGLGLASKRIAFPGKINLSAGECIVSFPGKYSEEWDRAVAVASEEETCSLACVFLTDATSGLGWHVDNPESPNGDCYCKALYGSVPLEAYVSEVDLTDPDCPIDQEQLAFRKADAKAMGQMLLVKYSHTTRLEWHEKKRQAMRKAHECWQQNQGRAPWGCAWFHLWKENVNAAVERNQSLHVFYFEGRVGAGKVSWDELGDEETRKNARQGGGLGASQTAEVAYLDKLGLPYIEHDVMEFNSFLNQTSPIAAQEMASETIGRSETMYMIPGAVEQVDR